MITLIGAAFAAGMIATINPCGFAMLPAYLGYLLGAKDNRRSILKVGFTVAAGFLGVFAVAGIVITAGLRSVINLIPWLAAVIGLGLIVVGLVQLRGHRLLPGLPAPSRAHKSRSVTGMFGFGVSYAIASLSCTLPIFLSLVAGSLAGRSLIESLLAFVAYGAGMSLIVMALTIAIGAGKEGLVTRIRPLARRMSLISGWIMIVAGGFVVWYWATVLSAGSQALSGSQLIRWIDELTGAIAQRIAERPWLIAIAALLLPIAWLVLDRRSRNPSSGRRQAGKAAADS